VALPVGGAGSTGAPTAVSQPAVVVEPDAPPSDGITIEFPHSTSQSFDFAVRAAQALPGFHQYGEGKKALYRVTVPAESVASSFELLEQLKGWRRRTVYVNGEKAPWDSVFAFQWCYEKRLGSYKPDFYCYGYENEYQFNLWGCIQAGLPFTERAEWFAWGRWLSKEGDWQFDKKRIQHELEKRLFHERFCPALQFDLVGQMLEALPDSVNPRRDSNWKFMESWNDGTPGGLKMRISRFGIEETVLMKGVCPNGQGGIAEIGKRLARIGLRLPPPS
jgi:hypothetical protein